jgi:hypothetical protein
MKAEYLAEPFDQRVAREGSRGTYPLVGVRDRAEVYREERADCTDANQN